MATLPEQTEETRNAALAKAIEARRIRSELKHKLKMGSLTLAELFDLADADEIIGKTKVLVVLESLPKVGKVTARRTMAEIGIVENRRLMGLGNQQRAKLLKRFSEES